MFYCIIAYCKCVGTICNVPYMQGCRGSAENYVKINGEDIVYAKVPKKLENENFCDSCNLLTANITSTEIAFI